MLNNIKTLIYQPESRITSVEVKIADETVWKQIDEDKERQKFIEGRLGVEFIRVNEEKKFN